MQTMSQRERLYLLAFAGITILFLSSVTFAHDDVVTPSSRAGVSVDVSDQADAGGTVIGATVG